MFDLGPRREEDGWSRIQSWDMPVPHPFWFSCFRSQLGLGTNRQVCVGPARGRADQREICSLAFVM